ncbi:hypothetical protein [Flavobacterium sp. J27]|uniref:hypothetical protein n=1 Tax=Flavobacterium sp. J27 TaxID=2060419 RepID=UPI001031FB0B|nr:hypothetical protein [Flavobacterium sp. J27]
MKQYRYMLVFVFLGFLLKPNETYACSKNVATEKTCCTSAKNKFQKKQHTCSDDKEENKSCQGNCDNSNCNVSLAFSSILPNNYSIKLNNVVFLHGKTNFSYLEKRNTIPYFSIWSPPKIS